MLSLGLAGSIFMGWAVGANDSANAFGTAVASRIISFRLATFLCGTAIIAGAFLQGEKGMTTYSGLATQDLSTAAVTMLSAALAVTIMTYKNLPISASQSVVGAITAVGVANDSIHWEGLLKVVICWIASPIGAIFIAIALYYALGAAIRLISPGILTRDKLLWGGLICTGVYASYALGANSVANATGVFLGGLDGQGLSREQLALLGGAAMALGSATYSRRVMMTIGGGVMRLDAFTALVAVGSMATTVHLFATLGVPVSTSQAIVGAIFGVGLVRGVGAIRLATLKKIGIGWLMTPAVSFILSAAGYGLFC